MQLTRKKIITTAMKLIEADGVETVTMNRLATELGCGLLPLYRKVPSRSALLDRIAEAVAPPPEPAAGASWTEVLAAQARALWHAGRVHPRCVLVLAGRPAASATMLRPAEQALAALHRAGFSDRDAVPALRAMHCYVIGALACQAGAAPGSRVAEALPRLRASEFPAVTAAAGDLAQENPDADFEFGLCLLLQALAAGRKPRP